MVMCLNNLINVLILLKIVRGLVGVVYSDINLFGGKWTFPGQAAAMSGN